MLISDLQLFDELAKKLGNRYLATAYVSQSARIFAQGLPKYIIESYLIHWVLIGEDPKHIRARIRDDADVRYMNEVLCYIYDEDVCKAVRNLYKKSIRARHLVYQSDIDLNKYQADRVKILLRMIWYQFE